MNPLKTSLTFLMCSMATFATANSLSQAQAIQNKTNTASASSQKVINQSAEAALSLKAEIEQLQEEVKNLEIYHNHLAALVDSQNSEAVNIEEQIDQIKVTRQGVVPLMYRMIDGLNIIIEDDAPLKREQRLARVEKLTTMMAQADVSDAERYRRILEAYQIEMDYGTKLGVYQGRVTLGDSQNIKADILHLGRVSLVARNLKGNQYWTWNKNSERWVDVDSGMKGELDKAYEVANQQVAPSLIMLPVSLNIAEAK
ncbi:DUF3450 domain-containing protein [Vibrio kyushuensis]|uniref:DUF3450 domain-containing protein n=1 Tax=Vibrio kyushuensis TaxID=2910249 RepID=UPI003D0CCED0